MSIKLITNAEKQAQAKLNARMEKKKKTYSKVPFYGLAILPFACIFIYSMEIDNSVIKEPRVFPAGEQGDWLRTAETLLAQRKVTDAAVWLRKAQRANIAEVTALEMVQEYRQVHGEDMDYAERVAIRRTLEAIEMDVFAGMVRNGDDSGALAALGKTDALWKKILVHGDLEDVELGLRILAEGNQTVPEITECAKVMELRNQTLTFRRDLDEVARAGIDPFKSYEKTFETVDRVAGLSWQDYNSKYLQKGKPVIITDYASKMFGGQGMDWETIKKVCGHVELLRSKKDVDAKHSWASVTRSKVPVVLREFMDSIEAGAEPEWSIMEFGLASGCKKLLTDFTVPKYFANDLWKRVNHTEANSEDFYGATPTLFVGQESTGTGIHTDTYVSTHWEIPVAGAQNWTFYAIPKELKELAWYQTIESEIFPAQAMNTEWELWNYPLTRRAEKYRIDVEVKEGELLVIPAGIPRKWTSIGNTATISGNVLDHQFVPQLLGEFSKRGCFEDRLKYVLSAHALRTRDLPDRQKFLDIPWEAYKTYGSLDDSLLDPFQ